MTTTSDARKRMAENAAKSAPADRPASTPAPVAALEVADADVALARRVHQVVGYVPAGFGDVLRLLRHPDVEEATRAALAPRPEPVVTPLPSEAVDDGLARIVFDHMPQAFDCTCGFYPIEGDPEPALAMHLAEQIIEAGYRLVAEDDEDTVRVRIAQAIEDEADDGQGLPGQTLAGDWRYLKGMYRAATIARGTR